MDMTKNVIPENVKTIHIIAVCGTGMGALASMLKELGYEVTGSDQNVYPPMSTFLMEKGIQIAAGYKAENVEYGPDLVVVGNAVGKDNPEVLKIQEMGLNFCSMPQALNRFVAKGKKTILATGTHGKTTTCSLLAWVIHEAGLDPSFMIGGILRNFNSNYRLGKGDYMVIEGDEYDTAFFDKGPKFLHYKPHIAVLTSVEFDHADIFRDLDHVKSAFDSFIKGLPSSSTLIAYDANSNVTELAKGRECEVEKYGRENNSMWQLGAVTADPPWSVFEVLKEGKEFGTFRGRIMGEHNLLNTLATIASADRLGISIEDIQKALETFESPKRRQEVRGVKNGITVMDDFAHHPTAVKETVKAVKPFYIAGRLIAVFEPRTNSSMRNVFQDVYPDSFDSADIVCVRKPPFPKKIPVSERFSSERLVEDLKNREKDAHYFEETDSIIEFLVKEAKAGDVVLVMSNGGFDNIHERLLESL